MSVAAEHSHRNARHVDVITLLMREVLGHRVAIVWFLTSNIDPSDRLSEQCHGPTKTLRSSNARQSLRVPLPFPRLLPSPLAGQRLSQPTPSNRESGKSRLLLGAIL